MRFIKIILILFLIIIFSGTVSATDPASASNNSDLTSEVTTEAYTYAADNPTAPPSSTVNLIFIHHSTGENWLNDGNGGLGIALRNNNYYVSDTNYGWGPNGIGSSTDIGNWWDWFRGPQSSTYLAALYGEKGQYSSYSRLSAAASGENEIIMFKSCFPNSALQGSPSDPVPSISNNPLKGESCGSGDHTVANAKGIYIDLLQYFQTRQDKLFIVITAPPLSDGTYASNARAFNQWLVNDWLVNYPYKNVFVFDFYNVLTSNGGNSNTNDLGSTSGSHHRWYNNAVQHQVGTKNTLAYPSSGGDDHPSQAGNLKATAEFLPLLNYAYNLWKGQSTSLTASASPQGKTYTTPQNVVLSSSYPADIYYTTDGSTPSSTSNKYISALSISINTILKFLAIDTDNNKSPVYTETYNFDQAPTVTSTNPTSDATDVSLTSPIVINFSENIVASTNFSNIYIKNLISGAYVSIASKTINGKTLTITQTSPRKNGTLYQVYIPDGAVKDAAGNNLATAFSYKFTTLYSTSDTTPPTVTSNNPVNDATGVSLTSPVVITFSENIVAGTNFAGIYIKNLTTGNTVSIASKTISGNTLTIKQTNSRISNNQYKVYLPAGAIKDAAGNNLASAYYYTFKTAGGTTDTTPPKVTSTSPVNGAVGVALTSAITIKFSENIVAGTNFSGIYIKNLTTGKIVSLGSKTISGSNLTLKMTYSRLSKNNYQVYLPAGAVKDASGNSLASSYLFQFKTA
jgi:methionine-rich copper-binding protein CopC